MNDVIVAPSRIMKTKYPICGEIKFQLCFMGTIVLTWYR